MKEATKLYLSIAAGVIVGLVVYFMYLRKKPVQNEPIESEPKPNPDSASV